MLTFNALANIGKKRKLAHFLLNNLIFFFLMRGIFKSQIEEYLNHKLRN